MLPSARLVPNLSRSPYLQPLQLPQAASAGHRQRVGHDFNTSVIPACPEMPACSALHMNKVAAWSAVTNTPIECRTPAA